MQADCSLLFLFLQLEKQPKNMEGFTVDPRKTTPEEFERGLRDARLVFNINHTMPYTEEYDRLVQQLFDGKIGEGSRLPAGRARSLHNRHRLAYRRRRDCINTHGRIQTGLTHTSCRSPSQSPKGGGIVCRTYREYVTYRSYKSYGKVIWPILVGNMAHIGR